MLADDPAAEDDTAPEGEDGADGDDPEDEAAEEEAGEGTEDDGGVDRSIVSVGVDPFSLGFNPHLTSDNTELVDAMADLVLPSAFHGSFPDEDVLDSAREIDAPSGVVQRVRYTLNDAAQWSDGTPITGADFEYLWREMISTPGVRQVAPYRAISHITTSAGGSVVTVDLDQRVDDWHALFAHLLPSHLLEAGEFESVLETDIPASAGKFSVASIDQARGMITLNRNDRFWGKDPADIDVVQLRAIRSTPQAATLLRSGQVSFVDIEPAQTLKEQLSLVSGVHSVNAYPTRQLRLNLSTRSEVLTTPNLRRTLMSLIDSEQVARLATERSADIRVPYGGNALLGTASNEELAQLRAVAQDDPIRIGVDPTDAGASNAAMTMVDMLNQAGVEARVVEDRMSTLVDQLLPEAEVDAILSGVDTEVTPANMASFFTCGTEENTSAAPTTSASAAPTSTTEPAQDADDSAQTWSGNLSLACFEDFEQTAGSILSGELSAQDGLALMREVNREQALYLPLIDETRIRAYRFEEDSDENIIDWHRGITSAPEWEVDNDDTTDDTADKESTQQ